MSCWTALDLGIGAIQLGCMYCFYYQSFLLLTVPEVLIGTIFTPLYVSLFSDFARRQFSGRYLITATLAVLGAAVIRYNSVSEDFWLGFMVLQGSNLSFAFGQVAYRQLIEKKSSEISQLTSFGYFYVGAFAVTLIAWILLGEANYPDTVTQWGVLIWLGLVASGVGYFLWNKGATLVNAGVLAAMNNALIPMGLIVNFLIWDRSTDWLRLVSGASILFVAIWLGQRKEVFKVDG